MSTLGCKNCGKRRTRNLKEEEVVILEEPQPTYIINPVDQKQTSSTIIDWKSMSKVI